MEAIKKKMQAMKLEKENAVDRAEEAEQAAREANLRAEKVRIFDVILFVFFNIIFLQVFVLFSKTVFYFYFRMRIRNSLLFNEKY